MQYYKLIMKLQYNYKLFFICVLMGFYSVNLVSQNASVTINEDDKIPQILELKKRLEKENKLAVGYTIQLYYGELSMANTILKKYQNNFEFWPASIEYETPNYKVWVGNFNSRLEADRVRLEINKLFPAAFILKPDRS